jgi:hypothetical protein
MFYNHLSIFPFHDKDVLLFPCLLNKSKINFFMPRHRLRSLFLFWYPLAATWLMMSVEGPFLAAVIARLAEPKYNLAAYGVAFAFALIIEAPIIMIMSASTALVTSNQTFLKLRNYTYSLNTIITALMVLFLLPPVFNFITRDLINLPDHVAHLTHIATIIMLPWPGAIGYRRFYQGILIRNGLTRLVAYGTIIRLTFMAITALTLYFHSNIPGVAVGATALSMGVVCEAIASRFMVHRTLSHLRSIEAEEEEPLTYKYITHFYYPLALTSILALGVHPLVTFFIGQSRMAIESLAVLPVINSLVFIFRSLGLSYQEVGIAKIGKNWESYEPVRQFAFILAVSVVLCLGTISFTPLAHFWLVNVSGLSPELYDFSLLPLRIMTLMPGLTVILSFQRSILVATRYTSPVTWATALEVSGIILVIAVGILYHNMVGVVAATLALILGRLTANFYLIHPFRKALKRSGNR